MNVPDDVPSRTLRHPWHYFANSVAGTGSQCLEHVTSELRGAAHATKKNNQATGVGLQNFEQDS